MRTIINWLDIDLQKPDNGDVCLVVFKDIAGETGSFAGTFRYVNGQWEHPEKDFLKYSKIRQDVTHWYPIYAVTLIK